MPIILGKLLIDMKKILFPTDFSKAAEHAFGYVVALAEKLDAQIDLVHIYPLPFIDATNVPPSYVEKMMKEKELVVAKKLEEFAQPFPQTRIGKKMSTFGMFIPEEICDLAKDDAYNLIVMGTRGEHHSSMEKTLGSITTHIMMMASCPVLAVPEDSTWKPIERIAFATDFEPKDFTANEALMSIAGKIGAKVYYIHVETKPGIGIMEDYVTLANYPFDYTDFAVVNSPSVLEGIDKYIREKHIDLLALFIPRRRLWERLFHTSFSKKMAFHTKVPLLVFHGK